MKTRPEMASAPAPPAAGQKQRVRLEKGGELARRIYALAPPRKPGESDDPWQSRASGRRGTPSGDGPACSGAKEQASALAIRYAPEYSLRREHASLELTEEQAGPLRTKPMTSALLIAAPGKTYAEARAPLMKQSHARSKNFSCSSDARQSLRLMTASREGWATAA